MKYPTNLTTRCKDNHGYNIFTYALLLSFCSFLMFLTSVINTHFNYNRTPYRDWALAGGVTSNSAQFRVRGPAKGDGIRREFVLSVNPNLAIEKDQILVTPVSYEDFTAQEHFMKQISINTLSPTTTYYYGITHPQTIPNSATMVGDFGKFTTPPEDGSRVNFTIATGSCALTGSTSSMFTRILDLNPVLFIHTGDFHYEDLDTLDIDLRLKAYDKVMGSQSQRQLYMRTIFSYIYDDHDWLGNNKDSSNSDTGSVAKKGYSLAIPHYELGAVQTGAADEATAAKYQAFTIGTVRFVISDLRSESIKSTQDFPGRIYSTEQRDWLFNELSQAGNYDFVVWVTSRPWTGPDEVGSDDWGGFVSDRNELSYHIASTIGAGPKNLLVLSGDNHMVAFDDGSSTDYSNQNMNPGGFPILHSGPMTNFGSGLFDFINPETNYFTDGCLAINSEVNHQFSTLKFTFTTNEMEDLSPCVEINSFADSLDKLIFHRKRCGALMRSGTLEQKTCTTPRLSLKTEVVFSVALGVIGFSLLIALWVLGFKRCSLALSYFSLGVIFFMLTVAAAVLGSICFGTLGVNVFAVSIFTLVQSMIGLIFIGAALYCHSLDNRQSDMLDGDRCSYDEAMKKGAERALADEISTTKMKEIVDDSESDEDITRFQMEPFWEDESTSVDYDYSDVTIPANQYFEVMYNERHIEDSGKNNVS